MLKILPLVKQSDIKVHWEFQRHFLGDPVIATGSFQRFERMSVSSHELNISPSFREYTEEKIRSAIMRRIYPQELLYELREIQCELAIRDHHHGLGGRGQFSGLLERLAVVTAQLAGDK